MLKRKRKATVMVKKTKMTKINEIKILIFEDRLPTNPKNQQLTFCWIVDAIFAFDNNNNNDNFYNNNERITIGVINRRF